MARRSDNPLSHFEWLLPLLLAALAATRLAPIAAPATLILLCYLPGRLVVAGFALGANWDSAGRGVLALATSLAVMPVLLNPIWHATNDGRLLLACVWLLLTVGYGLVRCAPRAIGKNEGVVAGTEVRLFDHTRTKVVFVFIVVLVAFAAIGTYWPTEPRGYPVPALIHDFIKHHAVLYSLEHYPLPLGNPFYADEAAGPVYYYHFFYLIPATVRALSPGLSIELAYGIQAALVGIGTAAMFYLFVKRFVGGDGPAILAALLATAIGGLDIIPLVWLQRAPITLDAWADTLVRIHNLLTQVVWTPQNVQGITIILVGVYTLSLKGWWKGWFILGPVLAAALVGSTVWVAAGVLPGLVIFVLFEIVARRRTPALALKRLLASGGVALPMFAVALPSLLGYLEMSHRHGKGLTAHWDALQQNAILGRLVGPGIIANLLDLPWVLAIEFGPLLLFPLLLPRRIWRRAWNDAGLRLLLISACVALVGFVTLRSHFTYNDFGQKVIFVPMTAGVVLAASIVAPVTQRPRFWNPLGWSLHDSSPQRPRRKLGTFFAIVLLLGLPVGIFQSPMAAVRRHLPQEGPLHVFGHPVADEAVVEADASRFLRHQLPPDAVVQAHWDTRRARLAQVAQKQIGIMDLEQDTMVFHPVDTAAHEQALREIAATLEQPASAHRCHQTLTAHHITHVFVGTVERESWSGLEKFADERYFELVFEHDEQRIYALRRDVPGQ